MKELRSKSALIYIQCIGKSYRGSIFPTISQPVNLFQLPPEIWQTKGSFYLSFFSPRRSLFAIRFPSLKEGRREKSLYVCTARMVILLPRRGNFFCIVLMLMWSPIESARGIFPFVLAGQCRSTRACCVEKLCLFFSMHFPTLFE